MPNYYAPTPPPGRQRTPEEERAAARAAATARGVAPGTEPPTANTRVRDQVPGDGGSGGAPDGGPRGGESGNPYEGPPGSGGGGSNYGGPPGTTGGAAAAANPGYTSPTGGLVGYYGAKMNSTGMSPDELNALNASTLNPIQQQAREAEAAMLRVRAATGNDAGIYGGLSEVARNAANQTSQQGRLNTLTNADVARKEQAEGSAGTLNLYGQTQAETMEYLRMLGNLLGRQVGTTTRGSTSGVNGEIAYNPGM